jgi:NhaA family Na+:H+ antiporter
MDREKNKAATKFGIKNYITQESLGGIILIAVTIIAVIWANSSFYDYYHYLWHEIKVGVSAGNWQLKWSLQHWINDGLMAVFFFMVGLEIKREVLAGELSSVKKASLPIIAAVGGMLIPALFYVVFNYNNPDYAKGWGIPMATDIAFALGLMSLLGNKVNINLKIFLTALAIADDLGAILVIAIFYTESIEYTELIYASIFLTTLMIGNRLGVRKTTFYVIIGMLGVWLSVFYSGVHATIAGVLIAFTIPVRPKVTESLYIDKLDAFLTKFKKAKPNDSTLLTAKQAHLINDIEKLSDEAHTPLQKLEHALHPITAFIILPLFALANAGIHVEGNILDLLFHPISLGIIAGLVLGKSLGIGLFAYLAVKFNLTQLPEGVSWKQIYGLGFLAGIGFTMSIFISDLAFVSDEFVQIAKVGIFVGSFISAVAGMALLGSVKKQA